MKVHLGLSTLPVIFSPILDGMQLELNQSIRYRNQDNTPDIFATQGKQIVNET